MEAGGKDRPPMLASGNYVQWKSKIKRYFDTKPNHELIHYCLKNPPYKYTWADKTVPVFEGNTETTTETYMENYKNVSQDIRDQLNAEAEAVLIILIGIDIDIHSTVDTCPDACEMWKAIERLKQEWQRFVTLVKQSQELKTVSYHKLYDILKQHQNEVNEIRAERLARTTNPLALVSQQQPVYHPQNHPTHYTQNSSTRSQQAATRNSGKAIVKYPPPIYDQEPSMVAEDDELSKDKDIDKLMAFISLSFKKIYKHTNNNLRTSSNTSRANQDNSPMISRGTSYDNQRICNVAWAMENVGMSETETGKDAAYHKEKMLLCKQEEAKFGFAIKSEHPEESKSVHDTYSIEQDEHNVIIDSLDMSYDREQIDQDDDDDLPNERNLLASLIEKLKCEIDDSKNRNKFLETSNKVLVDKLKVDACPDACEMWKAIERLKQGESINVQDLETNLYWEFGKFTSRDGESLELYYSRFYKMMNELVRNQCDVTNHQVNVQFLLQLQPEWQRFVTLVKQSQELKTASYHKLYDILKQHQNEVNEIRAERLARTANPLALVAQQQPVYHPQNHPTHYTQNSSTRSQQVVTINKGKAIANSPPPIYDQEPSMVAEDDEMLKDKEIDKLMDLISLSFKKIYKPTNNNLRTSSNTSRANHPRINKGTRYDNQRIGNVAGARENVGTPVRDDTDDEPEDQELEAHYMYMAQIQEVTPDVADNSGPIFDSEPLQKEMVADLRYFNFLELEVDSLKSQLKTQKTQFLNEIDRLLMEYYYADHMNAILGMYIELDEVTNLQCDYLETLEKCECLEKELSKSKMMSKGFEALQKHAINLELDLQQCQEKIKNEKSFKENQSKEFRKEHEQYFEIQDLKAQLQVKGIAINELKKLIEKMKGKSMETKFEKSSVIRNPNAFKSQRPSILGKPTIFSDSLERKDCSKSNKCVLNDKHDMCILHSFNGVNSRTKMPMAVPISTREPKRTVNQSVAKPLMRIVASKSTNQKSRHTTRKLYEHVSKACTWWYPKFTPPGYKWKPKYHIGNINPKVSMPLGNISRTANILEPMTPRRFTVSNTTLYSNFLQLVEIILFIVDSGCSKHMTGNLKLLTNFVEKFLGSVKFGNDHILPILGYEDLGNDLLTGSHGTDLYSITLQDTSSPNPICLMAKATSSQAWLWHRHLSHLNFDTINLLSKNDIVIGLLKLKFVKDHLCSSCELGKAKRKSFLTKTTSSSKRQLQLLHMDLCSPMQVESINGRKYVLVIVDDYSRYTWTHFLRSKDETPEVLMDFLRLVQRGLQAQVRIVLTEKGTEFLNKTLHAYFASKGINHQTSVARTPETALLKDRTSRAYRVVNKRTRVIVETIHVNFEELPQMASDYVSSDPALQCQKTALKHDSLSPGPQSQENIPQVAKIVTTSNELDLLFSLMFDELLNGSTQVVSKSFDVSTADAH
nr:hypothetical protein [Tanacetum cinerariifolium]